MPCKTANDQPAMNGFILVCAAARRLPGKHGAPMAEELLRKPSPRPSRLECPCRCLRRPDSSLVLLRVSWRQGGRLRDRACSFCILRHKPRYRNGRANLASPETLSPNLLRFPRPPQKESVHAAPRYAPTLRERL